jgi:hypothetical protein
LYKRVLLEDEFIYLPAEKIKVGDLVGYGRHDKDLDIEIFIEIITVGAWGIHDNALFGKGDYYIAPDNHENKFKVIRK